MNTANTTLESFELDSEDNQPCKLIGFVQLVKNEFKLSKFTFRLLCRRISQWNAIPIMASIEPSGSKNVVIHYNKLEEILGKNCLIQLGGNKLKKLPAGCCNILIKGDSTEKTFPKEEWIKGNLKLNQIRYINHNLFAISNGDRLLKRIEDEILAYGIPVPESEIELNDNDADAFNE